MNSLAINPIRRSKYFALTAAFALTTALFPARPTNAQQLRQGVSVQLAVTSNAAPMPDADNEDAWIVAITADGSMYFGVNPASPAAIAEKISGSGHQNKLYIKADARSAFANVLKVLEAARAAGSGTSVLLTAQPGWSPPGARVSPMGLEVLLSPSSAAGSTSTVVQVLKSNKPDPILRINNQLIPWAALPNTLTQLSQNQTEKLVVVKTEGLLPFAEVVQVIDTCRSAGLKVALVTPQL
jgi:biopolymer transport protein ExbD